MDLSSLVQGMSDYMNITSSESHVVLLREFMFSIVIYSILCIATNMFRSVLIMHIKDHPKDLLSRFVLVLLPDTTSAPIPLVVTSREGEKGSGEEREGHTEREHDETRNEDQDDGIASDDEAKKVRRIPSLSKPKITL
jgi:hypothetical protein